ncbi:MAG: 4Fe-4S dicluster domain-containing protein [Actinomycetota bacterium]
MKKLKIHLERCSGCKRCELECMAEHSDSKNYAQATISGPEPKTRIFVESESQRPVPLVCRHCQEPLCVSACMAGCMQKDPDTGVVSNMGHEQKCVGCWMCIMACPYGVINPSLDTAQVKGNTFAQALKCDFCPQRDNPACVEGCPNEAIEVSDIKENS